jgi:hypothetical protein
MDHSQCVFLSSSGVLNLWFASAEDVIGSRIPVVIKKESPIECWSSRGGQGRTRSTRTKTFSGSVKRRRKGLRSDRFEWDMLIIISQWRRTPKNGRFG